MNKNSFIKGKDLERYFELNQRLYDFNKLFPYDKNDDRAIVIVGCSFVDYLLNHILLAYFPNDDQEVKVLLEKQLSSFINKVRLIYCLGFINEIILNDLKLIGKIRNQFAHELYISFEDKKIQRWCKDLCWNKEAMLIDPPLEATLRDVFQVEINTIIGYLNIVLTEARGEKRELRKK